MMDLMNIEDQEDQPVKMDSVGSKISHIVEKYFPMGKFTSSNILEKYEAATLDLTCICVTSCRKYTKRPRFNISEKH